MQFPPYRYVNQASARGDTMIELTGAVSSYILEAKKAVSKCIQCRNLSKYSLKLKQVYPFRPFQESNGFQFTANENCAPPRGDREGGEAGALKP